MSRLSRVPAMTIEEIRREIAQAHRVEALDRPDGIERPVLRRLVRGWALANNTNIATGAALTSTP